MSRNQTATPQLVRSRASTASAFGTAEREVLGRVSRQAHTTPILVSGTDDALFEAEAQTRQHLPYTASELLENSYTAEDSGFPTTDDAAVDDVKEFLPFQSVSCSTFSTAHY